MFALVDKMRLSQSVQTFLGSTNIQISALVPFIYTAFQCGDTLLLLHSTTLGS